MKKLKRNKIQNKIQNLNNSILKIICKTKICKIKQNVARETSPMRHFLIIFISLMFIICINTHSNAAYTSNGIENFPDSYKPYLEILKSKHPDWNFTALYTELDWNYVIDNENIFGKNLVPKSYTDEWKNTKTGEYNVEVDSRMG